MAGASVSAMRSSYLIGGGNAARPTIKNPPLPEKRGIYETKCSSQYAERILATGRAVLLDGFQAQPTSHEFGSRPCRAAGLLLRELVLAHHAQGALEIFGDILPLGAGGNAALGIAQSLVVFPAANVANIFHISYLHLFWFVLVFLSVDEILPPKQKFFRDFLTDEGCVSDDRRGRRPRRPIG